MKNNSKKTKNISIDDLAIMVSNGFSNLSNEFNTKIDNLEEKLTNRMQGLERRIDDLAFNRASRDEVKMLDLRITRIEKKIGVSK